MYLNIEIHQTSHRSHFPHHTSTRQAHSGRSYTRTESNVNSLAPRLGKLKQKAHKLIRKQAQKLGEQSCLKLVPGVTGLDLLIYFTL